MLLKRIPDSVLLFSHDLSLLSYRKVWSNMVFLSSWIWPFSSSISSIGVYLWIMIVLENRLYPYWMFLFQNLFASSILIRFSIWLCFMVKVYDISFCSKIGGFHTFQVVVEKSTFVKFMAVMKFTWRIQDWFSSFCWCCQNPGKRRHT